MMKKSLGILVFSAVALAQAGASAGSSPVNIFDAARAGDLDAVAAYLAEGGDTEVSLAEHAEALDNVRQGLRA